MFIRNLFLWCFPGLMLMQVACAQDQDYPIEQVTDGIYYHQGVHEDATEENFGAIANVGFIVGNDCIAVIDSGGSYKEGELLAKAIKQTTDKPVCYVINTHVHPDHLLGNAAFKAAEPSFVGHEKLPAALMARKDFFEKNFSETLGKAYQGAEFISPDQTVAIGEPLTLDLGQREIVLTAYSTAHTDHDLTVLDKNTRTLWTGDLLFIDRIPALDGSINGWIENSKKLQQMQVSYVVPGHGPAGKDQWQQGWQKQLAYLTLIREQIRAIIYDFGTIDQATASVGLTQKDDWILFEDYHRRNVTAAFVELEWE